MIDSARPWSVFTGDCRVVLADMDEESVDAVVTDTPYGLSTLLDPPNLDREALWFKLTSGLVETPFRMLVRSWLDTGENPVMKGRGFMGKEWDALVPPPNTWRAVWRVMKPGAYNLAFGGTRTASLIEWSLRLADFEIDDTWAWLQGQGMAKRVRLDLKIDEHFEDPQTRATRRAKAKLERRTTPPQKHPARLPFVGWDRASAPKHEPIIVAVKPLRGTIAETALRYGTGGMNADGCRIPRGDAGQAVAVRGRSSGRSTYDIGGDGETISIDARGGFPANVIIDEGSAAELDRQTGPCGGAAPASGPTHEVASTSAARGGFAGRGGASSPFHGRVEGASSFFYTAKASTSERDKGLEDLPVLTPGERSGGREEGSAGISAYAGTRGENGRNPHPTVKPISLMRYLVRRAAPPGAWAQDVADRPLVLDCFMGSGSTGVACMVEGVRFVGAELDPAMTEVARMRLQHAYALPREEAAPAPEVRVGGQGKLF